MRRSEKRWRQILMPIRCFTAAGVFSIPTASSTGCWRSTRWSMSRVAHCMDNGPMEGFWGILKRERYYGRRFTSTESPVQMIQNYIIYYNTKLIQHNLGVLTPQEKHRHALTAESYSDKNCQRHGQK